jgi:nitronate monooxygenase
MSMAAVANDLNTFSTGRFVPAGSISDEISMLAAEIFGVDLVYLGTQFIATRESMADNDYRSTLMTSMLDDVRLSTRIGGIPASLLGSTGIPSPRLPAGFDQVRCSATAQPGARATASGACTGSRLR